MSNLISANFYRLWRSKAFWSCVAVTFAATLGMVCSVFYTSSAPTRNWDQVIIQCFFVPLFTVAVFAALYLGTEYSENTLRNKMIVGKKRWQIYLANLIAITAGGLIITAAGQLAPTAVALFAGEECITVSADSFAVGITVCVCAVIGACAFFTLVGMVVIKKSTAAAMALIMMIGAYAAAPKLKEMLDRPQYMTVTEYSESGGINRVYEEPNPDAVTGAARFAMETAYNILPFGAIEQAKWDTAARGFLPLYAFVGFAVMTGIGVLVFRKKDLK